MTINKTFCAALGALLLGAPLPNGATAQPTTALDVATSAGPVTGLVTNGVESWLGIPYAAPPVAELRWRPPQPVRSWTAPLSATTVASSCAQNADLGAFARAGGNEDCLYLNVYRSAEAAQSPPLPVFVWIHGGALQVGQGADYNPSKLAQQGEAVVVTLNYRLGAFGFFAHPTIDDEGHDFANYGLMDQQAALRWVQQNIAAFGGDPSNVTIAGESSGGNSVMAHIAAPGSAGLSHQAIAMSGATVMTRHPGFGAPRPLDVARDAGLGLAEAIGCGSGDAACLRAVPTKRILDVQGPFIVNQFIIDGDVLPTHPSDAFRGGNINHVTLINGTTRDEGRFFVALPELATGKALTSADYPSWLDRQYGALAPRVLREYPLDHYGSASEAFAATATDSIFACPALAMNRTLARWLPVYAYEFDDQTAPSYLGPTTFPLLAAHTSELAYLFPGFRGGADVTASLNPLQDELSDTMVSYFATADALPLGQSDWSSFDPGSGNIMSFALTGATMVSGRFGKTHHCDFWDRTGLY